LINPHIVRKNTSPVSAPPEAGIHWINTITKEEFFSVGTSSVADWQVSTSSLDSMVDVLISSPQNGDLLTYDSGTWKNKEDKSIINALIFG
jgi:hypothetical protein